MCYSILLLVQSHSILNPMATLAWHDWNRAPQRQTAGYQQDAKYEERTINTSSRRRDQTQISRRKREADERKLLQHSSWLFRTTCRTFFLNACLSFLHITAASRLAGDSSLGSDSMEMTEIKICSTPRIGLHRSSALSCELNSSSPGGWRMEMQTFPSA